MEVTDTYMLSSTLYKTTAIGLYGKPSNTNPVGGGSFPAAMALKALSTFSKVNQKDQIVKISPTFPEPLIDTVC